MKKIGGASPTTMADRAMRVLYNKVSPEYLHPLSKEEVGQIEGSIPAGIAGVIRGVEFACNTRTTQEGRTVRRGSLYDIRVNFCLKKVGAHWQSRLLSDKKEYLDEVKGCGGKPDLRTKIVEWDLRDAKRYACFILLHEIGHVIYL